jgi:hypothetical protein
LAILGAKALSVFVPRLASLSKIKAHSEPFSSVSMSSDLKTLLAEVKSNTVTEDEISSIVPLRRRDVYNMSRASNADVRNLQREKWRAKKDRRDGTGAQGCGVAPARRFKVGKCDVSVRVSVFADKVRQLTQMVNRAYKVDPDGYVDTVRKCRRNNHFNEYYSMGKLIQVGKGNKSDSNCMWHSLAAFDDLMNSVHNSNGWLEVRNAVLRFIRANPNAFVYMNCNMYRVSELYSEEVVRALDSDAPAPDTVLAAYCALYGRRASFGVGAHSKTYGCSGLEVPLIFVNRGSCGHWKLCYRIAKQNIQQFGEQHNRQQVEEIQISEHTIDQQQHHELSAVSRVVVEHVAHEGVDAAQSHVQGDPIIEEVVAVEQTQSIDAPVVPYVEPVELPSEELLTVELPSLCPAPVCSDMGDSSRDPQQQSCQNDTGKTENDCEIVVPKDEIVRSYQYTFKNNKVTALRKFGTLAVGYLVAAACLAKGYRGLASGLVAFSTALAATLTDEHHASIVFKNPRVKPFKPNLIVDAEGTQPSTMVTADITLTPIRFSFIPRGLPGEDRLFDFYRRYFNRDIYLYSRSGEISLEVFDASLASNVNAGFMNEDVAYDHIFRLFRTQRDYHLDNISLFSSDLAARCSMLVYKMRNSEQLGFLDHLSKMRR